MTLVADPSALAMVAVVGVAYAIGAARWRNHAGHSMVTRLEAWSFAAGLAVTAIAVASPLDVVADRTLAAHMVQHVLLLAVAAPLVALGAPLPALLWGLPPVSRRRALAQRRRLVAPP